MGKQSTEVPVRGNSAQQSAEGSWWAEMEGDLRSEKGRTEAVCPELRLPRLQCLGRKDHLSGLHFPFEKVTLQQSSPGRGLYVSCLNVIINSSASFHPSKSLGLDDKLYMVTEK